MLKAILAGNVVSGHRAFLLKDSTSDEDAARWAAHVPEGRVILVADGAALVKEFGELPAPAYSVPKNTVEPFPEPKQVRTGEHKPDHGTKAAEAQERKEEREEQKREDAAEDRAAAKEAAKHK